MESPYTPLLYPPSRREPTSTRLPCHSLPILEFSLLVVSILNCLLTAEHLLSIKFKASAAVASSREEAALNTTNSGRPLEQPSVFCRYHRPWQPVKAVAESWGSNPINAHHPPFLGSS